MRRTNISQIATGNVGGAEWARASQPLTVGIVVEGASCVVLRQSAAGCAITTFLRDPIIWGLRPPRCCSSVFSAYTTEPAVLRLDARPIFPGALRRGTDSLLTAIGCDGGHGTVDLLLNEARGTEIRNADHSLVSYGGWISIPGKECRTAGNAFETVTFCASIISVNGSFYLYW